MANFNINISAKVIDSQNIIGEPVAVGDLVYLSNNGKYYKAQASNPTKYKTELRLALSSGQADDTIDMLTYGYHDFNADILVSGSKYYVSNLPGKVTSTLYSDSNLNYGVRYVGTAYSDSVLLFNPDQTYINSSEGTVNDIPLESFSSNYDLEIIDDVLIFKKDNSIIYSDNLDRFYDDTNLARIISGYYDGNEASSDFQNIVLQRDDATTIKIDISQYIQNLYVDDTKAGEVNIDRGNGATLNSLGQKTYVTSDFQVVSDELPNGLWSVINTNGGYNYGLSSGANSNGSMLLMKGYGDFALFSSTDTFENNRKLFLNLKNGSAWDGWNAIATEAFVDNQLVGEYLKLTGETAQTVEGQVNFDEITFSSSLSSATGDIQAVNTILQGYLDADSATITNEVSANGFIHISSNGNNDVLLGGGSYRPANDFALSSAIGQSSGIAPLNSSGKVDESYLPDSILGQVSYEGTWDASSNTPTIPAPNSSNKGWYYIANTDVASGHGYANVPNTDFKAGDWIISDGVAWSKVDNSDAVFTVFGRNGNVIANESDYEAFYPKLDTLYDNPSWITSLAFSKITGVPDFALTSALSAYEPTFAKNLAFNKNFGTTPGTVLEGSRDATYLKNTGEEQVVLKDDTSRAIMIGKEFDETTSEYLTSSDLNTQGYTTANGYVQGSEIICRNTSNGYVRYEKMSDDDNDWFVFHNTNGWQILPVI